MEGIGDSNGGHWGWGQQWGMGTAMGDGDSNGGHWGQQWGMGWGQQWGCGGMLGGGGGSLTLGGGLPIGASQGHNAFVNLGGGHAVSSL